MARVFFPGEKVPIAKAATFTLSGETDEDQPQPYLSMNQPTRAPLCSNIARGHSRKRAPPSNLPASPRLQHPRCPLQWGAPSTLPARPPPPYPLHLQPSPHPPPYTLHPSVYLGLHRGTPECPSVPRGAPVVPGLPFECAACRFAEMSCNTPQGLPTGHLRNLRSRLRRGGELGGSQRSSWTKCRKLLVVLKTLDGNLQRWCCIRRACCLKQSPAPELHCDTLGHSTVIRFGVLGFGLAWVLGGYSEPCTIYIHLMHVSRTCNPTLGSSGEALVC
jgi:hypothetical protein